MSDKMDQEQSHADLMNESQRILEEADNIINEMSKILKGKLFSDFYNKNRLVSEKPKAQWHDISPNSKLDLEIERQLNNNMQNMGSEIDEKNPANKKCEEFLNKIKLEENNKRLEQYQSVIALSAKPTLLTAVAEMPSELTNLLQTENKQPNTNISKGFLGQALDLIKKLPDFIK